MVCCHIDLNKACSVRCANTCIFFTYSNNARSKTKTKQIHEHSVKQPLAFGCCFCLFRKAAKHGYSFFLITCPELYTSMVMEM